ncbi:MAG: PadR family transcriptional regulator [Gemmatimonadetes bacterium]|nr:PadR family transcriptional regulator [Gemmatimonadota bacterium]NNL30568.1 PadR family transcriptional regulator [Gemmatimonadota bacterium]
MRSPLKTQYFQILLALSDRALHGYGIQRAVLDQTDDGLKLWPATLYRSLARLEEDGLIEQVPPPAEEPDDERRQYYALTSQGRERLSAEADLMTRWVRTAREARS